MLKIKSQLFNGLQSNIAEIHRPEVLDVFGSLLQEGFWSWLSGVTDNSLYPVMFMSYLEIVVPGLDAGWRRTVILFIVSVALAFLNYRYATCSHVGLSCIPFPHLLKLGREADQSQKVPCIGSDLQTCDCELSCFTWTWTFCIY